MSGSGRQWSYEIDLPSATTSPGEARAFVQLHLEEHQLTHLVSDVRLVVSELATNATMHACTPFTVTLEEVDGTVRLSVYDGSPKSPSLNGSHHLDTGGRGLAIIEQVSRAWGISLKHGHGKAVWASFTTRGAGGMPG
jgi:anti-sigma regulatory factor (Ser/Thr protein kinase)